MTSVMHLWPPRGPLTACGQMALDDQTTTEINAVTCADCLAAHDEYMARFLDMTDPDEHLIGTPWDHWRANVAVLLGIEPADVSRFPDAYECFNTLMREIDYCAMIDAGEC